jgi:hypothetical protein
VRILLGQNLSPKLIRKLADIIPGLERVRSRPHKGIQSLERNFLLDLVGPIGLDGRTATHRTDKTSEDETPGRVAVLKAVVPGAMKPLAEKRYRVQIHGKSLR